MKKIIITLLLLICVLASCDSDDEKEDLPIETIEWKDKEGYRRYYTNDPEKHNSYSFQYFQDGTNNTMDTLEVTLKKKTGSKNFGYGVMFAIELDSGNNVTAFYYLLIDSTGYYNVQRYNRNSWTVLINWSKSLNLNTGQDIDNSIKIEYQNNRYIIYTNGVQQNSFSDTTLQPSNEFGFITCIGSSEYENFPNTPVDTYFKSTVPHTVPDTRAVNTDSFICGYGSITDGVK